MSNYVLGFNNDEIDAAIGGILSSAINVKTQGLLLGNDTNNDAIQLNTLITSIGGTLTDLYFPRGVYKIATNVVLPSNIRLIFGMGAILKVSNTYSITGTNTRLEAGLHQIFDLSLGGTLVGSWDIKEAFPQWFGAKGDDINDDTNAIQKCFEFSAENGNNIILPLGVYKTTSPITIVEYWTGSEYIKYKWPKISGGGSSNWSTMNASVIKGYNIAAERACLELLGTDNSAISSPTLDNFAIIHDSTCNDSAFCLMVGDSRNLKADKIIMSGKNALLTRCGSVTPNGSYSFMQSNFTNCEFISSSTKGWAVKPDKIQTLQGFQYDNIKFDTCLFSGLTMLYANLATLTECMFAVNPRRDLVTYAGNDAFTGYTIDYSTALWIGWALNVKIKNCYFEDYRRGILIQPIHSAPIMMVSIDGCLFNAWTNYAEPNSNPPTNYKADVAISMIQDPTNSGWVGTVLIKNNNFTDNTYSSPNTPLFQDTIIRNGVCVNPIIEDNIVSYVNKTLRIVDTYSKKLKLINSGENDPHRTKSVVFEIASLTEYSTGAKIHGYDILNYVIDSPCWIQKITVFTNKVFQTTAVNLAMRKNNSYKWAADLQNSAQYDTKHTETDVMYIIKDTLPIPSGVGNRFTDGDTLDFYISGVPLVANDIGGKVTLIVDLAY